MTTFPGKERTSAALVLDLNKTGCAIARCLGRAGVPVTGVHAAPYPALGALSRYVADPILLDGASDEKLLDAVKTIADRSDNRPVVLCATDQAVDFCSRNRSRLERHVHLAHARGLALHTLLDKGVQAEIAKSAGLDVPPTKVVRRGTPDLAHVPLPAIVKPANSLLGYKRLMGIESTRSTLLARVTETLAHCPHLVVSAYVPGPCMGNHTVLALACHDGSVVVAAVTRKLRQVPQLAFGAGSLVETCRDDEIASLAVAFIREAGLVGPVEVEFKREHGDGRAWFIEANLRCSALIEMTAATGLNLPCLAYRDALAAQHPGHAHGPERVIWVDELRDWRLCATGQISLECLLRGYDDVTMLSLFAHDDPEPFVAARRLALAESGADHALLTLVLEHLLAHHVGTAESGAVAHSQDPEA